MNVTPNHQSNVTAHNVAKGIPSQNDLIVDFPPLGRHFGAQVDRQAQAEKKASRRVVFSEMSLLSLFEAADEEENRLKWLSKEDRRRARMNQKVDVYKMRKFFESRPCDTITENEMIRFVGLESLLTKETTDMVVAARARHFQAVMAEQARQECCNTYEPESLRRVSQMYSKREARRKRNIALSHARMCDAQTDRDHLDVIEE